MQVEDNSEGKGNESKNIPKAYSKAIARFILRN